MEKVKEIRNVNNTYQKLGFNYSEKEEISVALIQLLTNYEVQYLKLRNFHWNVEGPDFFELHEEFEKDYNAIKSNIDTIAERMRVFGIKPKLTMEFIMEKSTIKEPKKELSAIDMVREILKDFEILHKNMLDVVNISLKNGDVATEHMITRFIEQLEKRNWMYTSWCK